MRVLPRIFAVSTLNLHANSVGPRPVFTNPLLQFDGYRVTCVLTFLAFYIIRPLLLNQHVSTWIVLHGQLVVVGILPIGATSARHTVNNREVIYRGVEHVTIGRLCLHEVVLSIINEIPMIRGVATEYLSYAVRVRYNRHLLARVLTL